MLQFGFVQQVFPENAYHRFVVDKRRKDNIGEEAFGAVAAPFVLLAASIAALENWKILRMLGKHLGNLQFGIRAQVTVIMVAVVEEGLDVISEVFFVF